MDQSIRTSCCCYCFEETVILLTCFGRSPSATVVASIAGTASVVDTSFVVASFKGSSIASIEDLLASFGAVASSTAVVELVAVVDS